MRIIVNADDFGLSEDTVRATIDCFERGAVTSATIMPGAPAADAAAEFARSHPEWSYGVHLTFVGDGAERPVSLPRDVPALVDTDGRLRGTNTVRALALLRRLPVDEIVREIDAQIRWVAERGVAVSHLDSHRHLHKFRPFRQALRRAVPPLGIRCVRTVQDVYLRRPLASPTLWLGRLWGRDLRASFLTTDHFYMPASAGDEAWLPLLDRPPSRAAGATLEIGVHPGFDEDWRDAERRAVMQFAVAARDAGHSLVDWRALAASAPASARTSREAM